MQKHSSCFTAQMVGLWFSFLLCLFFPLAGLVLDQPNLRQ